MKTFGWVVFISIIGTLLLIQGSLAASVPPPCDPSENRKGGVTNQKCDDWCEKDDPKYPHGSCGTNKICSCGKDLYYKIPCDPTDQPAQDQRCERYCDKVDFRQKHGKCDPDKKKCLCFK